MSRPYREDNDSDNESEWQSDEESSEDEESHISPSREDLEISELLSRSLATKVSIPIITKDESHYRLLRTSSGMSNYSDLLEDILNDHNIVDIEFADDATFYDEVIVAKPSQKKAEVQTEMNAYDSKHKGAKKAPSKLLLNPKSPERKRQQAAEYRSQMKKFHDSIKSLKNEFVPLKEDDKQKKSHLFRGKNLTSQFMDPLSKKMRMRERKEMYEYVTRKYNNRPILSDGLEVENVTQVKKDKARIAVRKYLAQIKLKERKNTLFNAGTSYTKAVEELKKITGLSNNAVVATSKLPWVASEYGVGQMGGSSGGTRGTDLGSTLQHRPIGYDKDKKPVNRVLANAFAISIPLQDYEKLRKDGDLVDVNVDVGFGLEPNRMIEEVTFNLEIDAKYVAGSLPLILPRLDRDYDKMSDEKKLQYRKIFGLNETKYKELQKKISQDKVEIGQITEHLIKHHGSLLRAITIKRDRAAGYKGNFAIPYNEAFRGGIEAIHTPYGGKLAERAARTGSSSKSSSCVEDGSSVSAQISRIRRDQDYADDELNNIFNSHLPQNTVYITPATTVVAAQLSQTIVDFKNDIQKTQAVIVINHHNHFTAIHIKKLADGNYEIIYFDPTVNLDLEPLHQIPDNTLDIIKEQFANVIIKNSNSSIQSVSFEEDRDIIDNNHCGPFTSYFIIEMCNGNIRLNENNILEAKLENGDWCEIRFNQEESSEFGKKIRGYHVNYLGGNDEIITHKNLIIDFLSEIENGVIQDETARSLDFDNIPPDTLENSFRDLNTLPPKQTSPWTYAEIVSRNIKKDDSGKK